MSGRPARSCHPKPLVAAITCLQPPALEKRSICPECFGWRRRRRRSRPLSRTAKGTEGGAGRSWRTRDTDFQPTIKTMEGFLKKKFHLELLFFFMLKVITGYLSIVNCIINSFMKKKCFLEVGDLRQIVYFQQTCNL